MQWVTVLSKSIHKHRKWTINVSSHKRWQRIPPLYSSATKKSLWKTQAEHRNISKIHRCPRTIRRSSAKNNRWFQWNTFKVMILAIQWTQWFKLNKTRQWQPVQFVIECRDVVIFSQITTQAHCMTLHSLESLWQSTTKWWTPNCNTIWQVR